MSPFLNTAWLPGAGRSGGAPLLALLFLRAAALCRQMEAMCGAVVMCCVFVLAFFYYVSLSAVYIPCGFFAVGLVVGDLQFYVWLLFCACRSRVVLEQPGSVVFTGKGFALAGCIAVCWFFEGRVLPAFCAWRGRCSSRGKRLCLVGLGRM